MKEGKHFSNRHLNNQGTMDYVSAKYADNSPLAQSLFSIEGITRVFYGGDHIAVGKQAEVGWEVNKIIEAAYLEIDLERRCHRNY